MWALVLVTWVDLTLSEYTQGIYYTEEQCAQAVAEMKDADESAYYKCEFISDEETA